MSDPTKPDGAPDKIGNLTQRDLEILSKAWGAMKSQPEIDYVKLAEACGMTNPRSASNAWSLIKKKLFINTPPAGAASKVGEATPKKRKAAAKKTPAKDGVKEEPNDEDDVEVEATPSKKPRATKAKTPKTKAKTPVEAKSSDDEADDKSDVEETPAPVKKEKAKPAAKAKTPAKGKKAAPAKAAEKEPDVKEDDEDGPEGADSLPAEATTEDDGEI